MANGDDNNVPSQEEFERMLEKVLNKNKKSIAQQREEIALRETLLGLIQDEISALDGANAAEALHMKDLELSLKVQTDEINEKIALMAKKKSLGEEILKDEYERLQYLAQQGAEIEKQINDLKEMKKSAKNVGDQFDKWLGVLGLNDSYLQTFSGSLVDAASKAGGVSKALTEIGEKLLKRLSPAQIIGTFVGNIEQQTVNLVKSASKTLAGITGLTMENYDKYRASILKVAQAQRNLGVSFSESAEMFSSLYTSFANFKNLTPEVREDLMKLGNEMKRFGVDGETFGQTIEFAQLALGKTITEAQTLTREIAIFSKSLKISAGDLMKRFSDFEGVIAEFGARGVEEFKKLATAADKAGVAMDAFLNIGRKFDFLDDAVTSVARINTLLGANVLDVMQLMRAPMEERSRIILDTIKNSVNLASEDARHLKILLARELGLKDVGELMRMVNNETKELTASQKKLNDMGFTQVEMDKLAEKATPPLVVLNAAMENFAILLFPLIETLNDFAQFMADNISPEVVQFAGIIFLVAVGVGLLKFMFGGVIKGIVALLAKFKIAGIGAKLFGGELRLVAASAKLATPPMLALSKASAGIIIPLTVMTVAMAVVVVAIVDLMKTAVEARTPIIDFTTALIALAFAAMMIGSTGPAGLGAIAFGAAGLATALAPVVLAFNTLDSANLNAVAIIFKNIGLAIAKNIDPFGKWIVGIKNFASAAAGSKEEIQTLSKWISSMNQLNTKVGKVEVIESMQKFTTTSVEGIREARGLIHELRVGGAEDTAKAVESMINAFNKKTEKMFKASIPNNIVIKLDDYEMGRWVARKNSDTMKTR